MVALVQPVQSWKASQMTGGRSTCCSPAATASGVSMSVIANPKGAAIINDEQNCRKERRLTPQVLNRSSIVPRSFELTAGDSDTGIPQVGRESGCPAPKALTRIQNKSIRHAPMTPATCTNANERSRDAGREEIASESRTNGRPFFGTPPLDRVLSA